MAGPDDRVYPAAKMAVVAQALAIEPHFKSSPIAHRVARTLAHVPAMTSLREVLELYKYAALHVRDPLFALRTGLRFHVSSYGMYGFAILSSTNLRPSAGRHLDHLLAALHKKLLEIERDAAELQSKSSGALTETIRHTHEQLKHLRQRIDLNRLRTRQAELQVLRWIARRGTDPQLRGAPRAPDPAVMQRRLLDAERYANAALDLALATIDDAEYGAVDALCAEQELAHAASRGSGKQAQ
jgi:hypothetical protein